MYKLLCMCILIHKGEYESKPICSGMVIFISGLFYFTFSYGGITNIAVLLGSLIVYFICLSINDFKSNKWLTILTIINIIEWFTVFIPTYIMYFNNMVFFAPSDYEIYFLLWKIYG